MSDQQQQILDYLTMREIALMVAFTTLVFLATSMFQIAIVSTNGYFNLGEAIVYLAAIIGGPIVGAVAGGLGSALADILTPYAVFAPATLLLKGSEGFVAGYLFRLFMKSSTNKVRKVILVTIISIFLISFSTYFTTPSLNGIPESSTLSIPFGVTIPSVFLIIVALALIILLIYVSFFSGQKGQMILACVIGGSIIVVGYFLYEVIFLNIVIELALMEVPANIAQVFFGIAIAVPVVRYLAELGIIEEDISLQNPESQISS